MIPRQYTECYTRVASPIGGINDLLGEKVELVHSMNSILDDTILFCPPTLLRHKMGQCLHTESASLN